MKLICLALVLLVATTAHSKSNSQSNPTTATKYIFESLLQSTGDLKSPQAPRAIEVNAQVMSV